MLHFIIGCAIAIGITVLLQIFIQMFNHNSRFGNPAGGVWMLTEIFMVAILIGASIAVIAIGTASAFKLLGGYLLIRACAFVMGLSNFAR